MTLEQATAFVAFSVAAAGTPGPSNVLLTATGAHVGVLRGLPCLLGVALGMALLMFIVAFGLGSVILTNPLALKGVKWCGAVILCWLAWEIATARRVSAAPGDKPVGLVGAAAFQWVNPKSWLVCASAAATFLDEGAGSAPGARGRRTARGSSWRAYPAVCPGLPSGPSYSASCGPSAPSVSSMAPWERFSPRL